jgi:hypothetical protein
MGSRSWIKIHCNKWLEGTIREEPPDVRGVWIDLLCLAGSGEYGDDGIIAVRNNVGFSDSQIKKFLKISNFLWKKTKNRLLTSGRISINNENVISIINWKKYQSEYKRQTKYRRKFTSENTSKSVTIGSNPDDVKSDNKQLQDTVTPRDRDREYTKMAEPSSYETWKNQLRVNKNKVGVIGECFRQTHTSAPPEDLNGNLYGRVAALVRLSGNDYGRVLQIVWQTAAQGIEGSHLNYIQGIIRSNKVKDEQKPKYVHQEKAPWER